MKPYFQDLVIDCWQHRGKLGCAEPCICLHHSRLEVGQPILVALQELSAAEPPTQRALTLQPTQRKRSIATIRLQHVPSRDELRVLHIACAREIMTIEMTAIGLQLLHDAVAAWLNGSEDFGIGPHHANLNKSEFGTLDKSSGERWFWGPYYAEP